MIFPKFSLIAGLGNPGPEYASTFHNAGYLFAEFLAEREGAERFKDIPERGFSYARTPRRILVKPLTYMNDSGRAVSAALAYFKIPASELLVAQDDSDIPLGEYKASFGRGAAGHHGIESVQAALGTPDFWRLRIGIRAQQGKAGAFVLQPIPRNLREDLYGVFGAASENVIEKETPPESERMFESGRSTESL